MKLVLVALSTLLLSATAPPAMAARTSETSAAVQASMLVSGKITVAPDGSVSSYTLDKSGKLPTAVIDLLGKIIPRWRFQPVERDGKPVVARTAMHLRLVAKPLGGQSYAISVGGSWFGSSDHRATTDTITYKEVYKPRYPDVARVAQISGTVYLLLSINREGDVEDVAAQEVDLMVNGSPRSLKQWRHWFSYAALRAAKYWKFNIPITGKNANDEHFYGRVAVHFNGGGALSDVEYGQWTPYVPGPRQQIPWAPADKFADGDVNAIPDGGIYAGNDGLHLLNAPKS